MHGFSPASEIYEVISPFKGQLAILRRAQSRVPLLAPDHASRRESPNSGKRLMTTKTTLIWRSHVVGRKSGITKLCPVDYFPVHFPRNPCRINATATTPRNKIPRRDGTAAASSSPFCPSSSHFSPHLLLFHPFGPSTMRRWHRM